MTFNCVVHKLALKAVLKQHFKNILGNWNLIKINIENIAAIPTAVKGDLPIRTNKGPDNTAAAPPIKPSILCFANQPKIKGIAPQSTPISNPTR